MKRNFITIQVLALITAGQVVTAGAEERVIIEALANKNSCFQCHGTDKNGVGPSFRNVAEKYKNDARARDTLIEIMKNGGKGNWTEISRGVPMPPYRSLSDEEIKRLVEWVLSH